MKVGPMNIFVYNLDINMAHNLNTCIEQKHSEKNQN